MRFLFFIMGVPLMIFSLFEAVDAISYVSNASIIFDGTNIELSEQEQIDLKEQIEMLFSKSHTMPSFGVAFDDMFDEIIQNGTFIRLKFDNVIKINDLPFDELIFNVSDQNYGVDLIRRIGGVCQGRCVHVDFVGNNMSELSEFVDIIVRDRNDNSDQAADYSSLESDLSMEYAGK